MAYGKIGASRRIVVAAGSRRSTNTRVMLSVSFEADVFAAIRDRAATSRRSVSAVVRELVECGLKA